MKNLDLVSQPFVIGEKRRFLTALLTLDPEAASHFAQQYGLEGKTLHDHPKLIEHLQQEINEKVNSLFARVEHVRDFRVLPRDFTVEENFAEEIESMYKEG